MIEALERCGDEVVVAKILATPPYRYICQSPFHVECDRVDVLHKTTHDHHRIQFAIMIEVINRRRTEHYAGTGGQLFMFGLYVTMLQYRDLH